MKIIGTILICLAAGVAILIGVGFGFTSYLSYKGARVPVYQTEISDFEFQQVSMNDKEYAAHVTSEMNELTEVHGVKKLKCFIFHANPNRTVYRIIMVGNITTPKDKDFSEYLHEESLLKDDTLLSTLELCGISPQQNKVYTKLTGLLPNASPIYINKNHIILDQVVLSKKCLKSDEEMKVFLEQIIRPRNENK